MPEYKYSYFDIKARGETARMLFALAGQKYEDVRIKFEDWPGKLKAGAPFGSVPTLQVDENIYCQTLAIERFLAKKFKLCGETAEDQLKADMITECVDEIRVTLQKTKFASPPENKAKLLKEFNEVKGPVYFQNIENMINADGYCIGKKISWPDVAIYNVVDFAKDEPGFVIDQNKIPKVKGLLKKVETEPRIASWLASRPKTKF